MNIKKGLKRVWIVVSVLWVISVIGFTVYSLPDEERHHLIKEIITNQVNGLNASEEDKEKIRLLKELAEDDEVHENDKNKSLLLLLYGLGALAVWWGLLYTGFWITSGFSGDEKKGETDE